MPENMSGHAVKYYKIDSAKVTFREYWCSGFTRSRVLIAFLLKIFGVRLASQHSIPWPIRLRDSLVNESEVPTATKEKFVPLLEECRNLGFEVLCYQKMKNVLALSDVVIVSLVHSKKAVAARIFFGHVLNKNATRECLYCFMVSWLDNGIFLLTGNSNEKLVLDNPPDHDVQRLPEASVNVLFEAHANRLEKCCHRNPPRLIQSLDDFEKMVDALEESGMEFRIQRGVLVEMTPKEISC